MALELKTRQWGHSLGIVIPRETVDELRIKPNEEVLVEIRKRHHPLKELFGSIRFSKPAKQILKEVRRELESKWLH